MPRAPFLVLLVLALPLGAAPAPPPRPDYQKKADAAAWEWSEDHATLAWSINHLPTAYSITMDIVGARWVGTYQVMGSTYPAGLKRGNLRVGRFDWRFRLVPGTEPSGPCEILGPGWTLRAIYRLERGRLLICSSTRASGPRPQAFRVTPQSDLWTFRPVPGK